MGIQLLIMANSEFDSQEKMWVYVTCRNSTQTVSWCQEGIQVFPEKWLIPIVMAESRTQPMGVDEVWFAFQENISEVANFGRLDQSKFQPEEEILEDFRKNLYN